MGSNISAEDKPDLFGQRGSCSGRVAVSSYEQLTGTAPGYTPTPNEQAAKDCPVSRLPRPL